MKKILRIVLLFLLLLFSNVTFAGKCTGSSSCTACSNCHYCKYCNEGGGSCGVCRSSNTSKYNHNKSSGNGMWILVGIGGIVLIGILSSNKEN